MNKILNINLGGYALTIDDDAFEYLSAYLESIRKKFKDSEGRDEILSDIEARLGELIYQDMKGRSIVMLPDVEAAVQVMGKPEDFETETSSHAQSGSSHRADTGSSKSASDRGLRTGKRLFRDEEDKVVSGVCSGLAAYFGFQDPVWMRLIFVGLTFASAGFWIPAYLLLAIMVPKAKTAADRLAMRGEPINVDNIAKEIEESVERLGTKMGEFGEKMGDKKMYGAGRDAVHTGTNALGHVFAALLKFFSKFGIFIAILVGLSLFIGLAASWVGGVVGMVTAAPYVGYFSPYSSAATWMAFANTFFVLGLPVIGLVLTFVRLLFKTRTPGWLSAGLGIFWVLNFVSLILLVAFGARDYRQSGTVSQTIDLSQIGSDTLHVEGIRLDQGEGGDFSFNGDFVQMDDNGLHFDQMADIRVTRAEEGRFVCRQILTARGRTRKEAMENAANTPFNLTVVGNKLRVPLGYAIPKGSKWKGQKVRLNIELPNGKYVVFDENIYNRAAAEVDLYDDGSGENYISRRPGKLFKMTPNGLVCVDCDRISDSEFGSDRTYEHFILEGNFKTEIRKRDGDGFRYSFEDPASAKLINVIRAGDRITFTSNGAGSENVRLIIEAPVFTSLVADNTGDVAIRGFDEGRASISAKGASHIKAYFDCNDLDIALTGKCTLELDGRGNELKAALSGGAVLEAPNFRTSDAEVSASEGARAHIYASDSAKVNSDADSKVKVEGGAHVNNKDEN